MIRTDKTKFYLITCFIIFHTMSENNKNNVFFCVYAFLNNNFCCVDVRPFNVNDKYIS